MLPNLIMIGAPGSGKGTQAQNLIDGYGYKHLSTGDLLRAEISKKSDIGNRVAGVMARGELVTDNLVLELLKSNVDLKKGVYIFDGFPRNIDQAIMLESELLDKVSNLKVIYFKLDLKVLKERIINRRSCSSCGEIYNLISKKTKNENVCDKCGKIGTIVQRKDDTEAVVDNRLEVFKKTFAPMIDFYKGKNLLVELDADRPAQNIFEELKVIIG
jgi:adenylate kinase